MCWFFGGEPKELDGAISRECGNDPFRGLLKGIHQQGMVFLGLGLHATHSLHLSQPGNGPWIFWGNQRVPLPFGCGSKTGTQMETW